MKFLLKILLIVCIFSITYAQEPQSAADCQNGQYFFQYQGTGNEPNACRECLLKCETCINQEYCIECAANSNRDQGSNCLCSDGYFEQNQKECGKCDSSCATCQNANTCITCSSSENIVVDGKCVPAIVIIPAEKKEKEEKSNLGLILGIVIGIVVIILVSILVVYICKKRKQSEGANKKLDKSDDVENKYKVGEGVKDDQLPKKATVDLQSSPQAFDNQPVAQQ